MNIFVLNSDPILAARDLFDCHVRKMIVESAQMLSTAQNLNGIESLYKPCYINHPNTKWARESNANYDWLVEHAREIGREFERRFGKAHKTASVVEYCGQHRPKLPKHELTNFALSMPPQYKSECAITSYRTYYIKEKSHLAKWTKRERPEWYGRQIGAGGGWKGGGGSGKRNQ